MLARTHRLSRLLRPVYLPSSRPPTVTRITASRRPPWQRSMATKSVADEKIEEIQELYGTAKDEFEIATEETEKHSVYARDDREAAREELAKLKEAFDAAVADTSSGSVGEEIKRRIGQRVRELDAAVEELNKADFED